MLWVNRTAEEWVKQLSLAPHPEGGYYRETYRAETNVQTPHGARSASTMIYFLLRAGEVSHLHRIRSDEAWHFYAGDSLCVHQFDGGYRTTILGPNPEKGEVFQSIVPAGAWFGASLLSNTGYSLVGCTVAPGFDFTDFELADYSDWAQLYPRQQDVLKLLCLSVP